jgi:hypothetical protein
VVVRFTFHVPRGILGMTQLKLILRHGHIEIVNMDTSKVLNGAQNADPIGSGRLDNSERRRLNTSKLGSTGYQHYLSKRGRTGPYILQVADRQGNDTTVQRNVKDRSPDTGLNPVFSQTHVDKDSVNAMQMQCLAFRRENAAPPKDEGGSCLPRPIQTTLESRPSFHQKLAAAFGLGAVGLAYRSE